MSKELDVIDLIKEDKGDNGIDKYINSLPKNKQKSAATEMLIQFRSELSNNLLEQKLMETKLKKLNDKVKQTEPMKAMAEMKKQIKKYKKDSEKMSLILLGCVKMAKALGVELPNIKAIAED